jgi:hypothetical protein
MRKKHFIALPSGVNVIKTSFLSLLILWSSELKPSLTFVDKGVVVCCVLANTKLK